MTHEPEPTTDGQQRSPRPPWQYSLRTLMAMTTAAAAVCGLMRWWGVAAFALVATLAAALSTSVLSRPADNRRHRRPWRPARP